MTVWIISCALNVSDCENRFCSLMLCRFYTIVYFDHMFLVLKQQRIVLKMLCCVLLPCKKIFSNHSITGCWMTEVMFFFSCHKGIISGAGIMHICMLGKEGLLHLCVQSPCGMRKSFPVLFLSCWCFAVIWKASISTQEVCGTENTHVKHLCLELVYHWWTLSSECLFTALWKNTLFRLLLIIVFKSPTYNVSIFKE